MNTEAADGGGGGGGGTLRMLAPWTPLDINSDDIPAQYRMGVEDSDGWYRSVDYFFLFIFFVEFFLRYLIQTQFEKHMDIGLNFGLFPRLKYICTSIAIIPCHIFAFFRSDVYCLVDFAILVWA